MTLGWFLAAAAVTVTLWHVPGGNYILYPFTVLATWFHEMAHGLMALLLGGHFKELQIFPDGSGYAIFSGPLWLGQGGTALVAAAGPMGPPLAGAALILASCNPKASVLGLGILGTALVVSTLLWVRSVFGMLAIPLLGVSILVVTIKGSPRLQGFAAQFLGVQACISTYRQVSYLFSPSAGNLGPSDTAMIQNVLVLPYWFWGAVLSMFSFAILFWSLRHVSRQSRLVSDV